MRGLEGEKQRAGRGGGKDTEGAVTGIEGVDADYRG